MILNSFGRASVSLPLGRRSAIRGSDGVMRLPVTFLLVLFKDGDSPSRRNRRKTMGAQLGPKNYQRWVVEFFSDTRGIELNSS